MWGVVLEFWFFFLLNVLKALPCSLYIYIFLVFIFFNIYMIEDNWYVYDLQAMHEMGQEKKPDETLFL